MNLGIVIKSRNSKEGGGYTITYDILDALIKNSKLINHKLFFVIINDYNKEIENKLKKKKFNYFKYFENNKILKIKNFFFSKYSFINKFFNFFGFNKIEKYFMENNVKMIWPVSSEMRYPFDLPYIFTVWDVQHKTIPQYPEVGSFLIKTYRDQIFKSNFNKAKYILFGNKSSYKIASKFYKCNKEKIFFNCHPTPSWALTKKSFKINNFFKKKKIKNFFIYPANFWMHKNHLNLLKGFNIFQINKKKLYQLILVGDVKDKKLYHKIKTFIKENNIQKNVKILGHVTREELLILYDNCLGLIYLSVSGPENLPPLEALARGKPVLYSNFFGSFEQLKNNAIYINHFNPRNIATGIEKLSKIKGSSQKRKRYAKSRTALGYIKKINSILNKQII